MGGFITFGSSGEVGIELMKVLTSQVIECSDVIDFRYKLYRKSQSRSLLHRVTWYVMTTTKTKFLTCVRNVSK